MRIRYAAIAGALLVTACGGPATAPAVTVTVSAPPTSEAPSAGAAPAATVRTAPKKAAAAAKVRVPNVVGVNHQVAQDTLQAAGFFRLTEKDATGQDRLLLWDRNWVVVRQSPKAGTLADPAATTLTLYSKKIGE